MVSGNIKSGVKIFNVTGSMVGESLLSYLEVDRSDYIPQGGETTTTTCSRLIKIVRRDKNTSKSYYIAGTDISQANVTLYSSRDGSILAKLSSDGKSLILTKSTNTGGLLISNFTISVYY